MPTTTGELGLTIPTDGGSSGVWGDILNDALEDVDAKADVGVSARLKKSGGTMTGRVDLHSTSSITIAKGTLAASDSLDLAAGNVFVATATGPTTLSFTNVPTSGMVGFLLILTGGGANMTWPASVKWPSGVAPTLTASPGIDVLAFITVNGGTTWRGNVVMYDSR